MLLSFVKSRSKYIIITILFFLYVCISAFSYVSAVSSNISDNVLRLHVIANSDTEKDQNLKLLVRDALLNYMNSLCIDCTSKEEVIEVVRLNLNKFKTIAQKAILDNGFNYTVNLQISNFHFPTKSYGDISLPAGCYDSLQVEIGEAKGQNWWCVMFPPLCFVNISSGIVPEESKFIMKSNLSDEEFAIISEYDNSSEVKFKFKLIELLQNVRLLTAKN